MNNIKSFAVLIGVAVVSVALLSMAASESLADSRFLLTAFCVVLAEIFVWAAATNPLAAGKCEFHQALPLHAGMGVMAGLNLLGAVAVVWLYLGGCDYTPLVVITALLLLAFVIGASLMMAATRKVAEQGRTDDAQNSFMQLFRMKLNDLAERVRADSGQDSAVKNRLERLCDEARYKTLQSLPGSEGINEELSKGLATLENGIGDSASALDHLSLLESILKRRENIIKQLRG